MAERVTELRINLCGPNRLPPPPEGDRARRAILAIGRQITEAMARVRLTAAEGWVRCLPRIHYANHLTGGPNVNAECRCCGITAADLPYEELGLDLDQASELLFEDGLCQGCGQLPTTTGEDTPR